MVFWLMMRGSSPGVVRGVERDLSDPEVPAKAIRRRFSAKYKKNILEKAEACKGKPSGIGALLRREDLIPPDRLEKAA